MPCSRSRDADMQPSSWKTLPVAGDSPRRNAAALLWCTATSPPCGPISPRRAPVEFFRRAAPGSQNAERLVLADLIENRSEVGHIQDAIAGTAITVVRLHAALRVLKERIRRREPDPNGELSPAPSRFPHAHTTQ